MTMGAQEEINSGLQEVGVGSEGGKGKARQLKTSTSSWQIMQAINRLEQGLRSDSLAREMRDERDKTDAKIEALRQEVKTDIGNLRKDMHEGFVRTDNKIEALRQETNNDFKTLRQETKDEFEALRQEMKDEFKTLHSSNLKVLAAIILPLAALVIAMAVRLFVQ